MDNKVSEAIKFARFPLALLIIFKHYYTNDIVVRDNLPIYSSLGRFSTDYFPAFVVPLFFFISGYLFFQGIDNKLIGFNSYSWNIYKTKISRRIKSLLIPYLAWNFIVLTFLIIAQLVSSDSFQPFSKSLSEFTIIDFFNSFWGISADGYPIDGPLWFIRDLFIICLFTPVIFFWVRYTRLFGLLLLIVLYLSIGKMLPVGPSTTCQFFFCFGASSCLLSNDLVTSFSKINYKLSASVLIILLVIFSLCEKGTTQFSYLLRLYRFASVIFLWPILIKYCYLSKNEIISSLSNATFFIFASHKPLMYVISILIFSVFKPDNEFILCALILIIPLITCMICLLGFYFMKRFMPSLKFLNGYRL